MPFIEHPDEIILWGSEMEEIWKDKSFIFSNDDTKVHILGSYRFAHARQNKKLIFRKL